MEIKRVSKGDYPKAQKFYSSVGYFTEIQPIDIVFGAWNEGKLIGLVRLSPEGDPMALRGMMIAETYQRKGVGTLLLKKLEPAIADRDCFCLPHDWLEDFYKQIGFEKFEEIMAPKHLQERIKENRKKYPRLIVMKRPRKK